MSKGKIQKRTEKQRRPPIGTSNWDDHLKQRVSPAGHQDHCGKERNRSEQRHRSENFR